MIRLLLLIFLSLLSSAAFSGEVDLRLTMSFENFTDGTKIGERGKIKFSIFNAGPDIAGNDYIGSGAPISLSIGYRLENIVASLYFFEVISIDNPLCEFDWPHLDPPPPDDYVLYSFFYVDKRLAVGETFDCEMEIEIIDDRYIDLRWQLRSLLDDDPNLVDNEVQFIFRGQPEVVPVNSVSGVFILILSMLLLAWKIQRQNPRSKI